MSSSVKSNDIQQQPISDNGNGTKTENVAEVAICGIECCECCECCGLCDSFGECLSSCFGSFCCICNP